MDYEEEEVFKDAEGDGNSWSTAYWLVYVHDSIAKELDNNDINYYKAPLDPELSVDYSKHFYGKKVPADVSKFVDDENKALSKEIDDNKNKNIVS